MFQFESFGSVDVNKVICRDHSCYVMLLHLGILGFRTNSVMGFHKISSADAPTDPRDNKSNKCLVLRRAMVESLEMIRLRSGPCRRASAGHIVLL